jgi:preprotein translocase subunit SecB
MESDMAKKPKNGPTQDGEGEMESEAAAPAAQAITLPQEPAGAPGPQPGANVKTPALRILVQYLKDLSFENPNAPQAFKSGQPNPNINISVSVNAKTLGGSDFEVELHLDAKAMAADKVMFASEVLYAGIFHLENIPQQAVHQVVYIECPRMLFPFARQILADATRNGGFPPLMLDPIDFGGLYHQRMAQQKQQPVQQA